jgi:hypothetical protein
MAGPAPAIFFAVQDRPFDDARSGSIVHVGNVPAFTVVPLACRRAFGYSAWDIVREFQSPADVA